jgi:hypothetical protein
MRGTISLVLRILDSMSGYSSLKGLHGGFRGRENWIWRDGMMRLRRKKHTSEGRKKEEERWFGAEAIKPKQRVISKRLSEK